MIPLLLRYWSVMVVHETRLMLVRIDRVLAKAQETLIRAHNEEVQRRGVAIVSTNRENKEHWVN